MTPKYALFGCNPLAIEVAWRLSLVQQPFVMLDRDPAMVELARQEGLVAGRIDYTDDDALRAAGIGSHIEGVFCLLGEDSENVFLAISARALDPGLRIVSVCQAPEAAPKLLAAGADKVVDPYEISGARVHELIERPEVVELMEQTVFGLQDLNIAEVTIPDGSWLNGVRLSELRRRMAQNVLLLGVVDLERGKELIFSTRGIDHNLDHQDVLVVIGPRGDVEAFRTMIESPAAPAQG
ncbi:MAG: TrkA family potassium uptake protein [Betaproteobacteria bacterium]|nr:TrkA family potassium uptake protein [Betaproteobacteria bacterium]